MTGPAAGDGERRARSDTDASGPLEASPRLSLPVRAVLVVVGTAALVIGVIGIVVPVLPTTPFLLVAAACYARSSTRLYAWLLGQPSLGRIVAEWRRSRSLPPGVKARALLIVALTFAVSIVLVDGPELRLVLMAIGSVLAYFLWRVPAVRAA
ncbi:MAG TPA: YbaN family protein [Candidatus Deferrimicrobium sp.]|nr:YbaN family protein [Candidatus Deferrimicrobium sp.]